VDFWNVAVIIQCHGNIYLVADLSLPDMHCAPLVGLRPSYSMCFLIDLLLLHEVRYERIGYDFRRFDGSPESVNFCESVSSMEGVILVAQCWINVILKSSIHIEFKQCQCAVNRAIEYGTLTGVSTLYTLGYNSKQVPAYFLYLLPISLRNFLISHIFWSKVVVSRER
jgi:hypothetical protein